MSTQSYNPFESLEARLDRIENLLINLQRPQQSPELPDRCQLKEACEITGLKEATIYKLTSDNTQDFPFEKFGRRLIFSRKKLAAWVEANTLPSSSPEDEMKANLIKSAKKHLNK